MDWPNPVFWTFSFVWYHYQQALRANPWKSCRVLMGKKFYGTMFYLSTIEFLSSHHHCFGQHCNFTFKKWWKHEKQSFTQNKELLLLDCELNKVWRTSIFYSPDCEVQNFAFHNLFQNSLSFQIWIHFLLTFEFKFNIDSSDLCCLFIYFLS